MADVLHADHRQLQKRKGDALRRSKYGVRADKVGRERRTVDGILFASQKEATRYRELKLLECADDIKLLRRQEKFPLAINGQKLGTYIADFYYFDPDKNEFIVEDVKGFKTPIYRLKKKLVKALYNIDIQEV